MYGCAEGVSGEPPLSFGHFPRERGKPCCPSALPGHTPRTRFARARPFRSAKGAEGVLVGLPVPELVGEGEGLG